VKTEPPTDFRPTTMKRAPHQLPCRVAAQFNHAQRTRRERQVAIHASRGCGIGLIGHKHHTVKTSIFRAIILVVSSFILHGADTGEPHFIRTTGSHKIAPKMTLEVSRDPSGVLRYSFDRTYREPQASARVQKEGTLTEPFLFYWHESSQVLWQATAKQIVAHTPKGTTVYDNSSKTLERAPDMFRKEVARVFISP
jgi:hypothetical protein